MAALDAKPGEKLSLPSKDFFASVIYHVVGSLQEQVHYKGVLIKRPQNIGNVATQKSVKNKQSLTNTTKT